MSSLNYYITLKKNSQYLQEKKNELDVLPQKKIKSGEQ